MDPKIEEPAPKVEEPAPKPDENTVEIALDNFERSLDSNANLHTVPTEAEWDSTPVSGGPTVPPAESFIVPIDSPEGRLNAARQKNVNTYAAKKTLAQGMMDIALITANANQLRYIIEYTSGSKTYYINLVLISLSLILQVAVGMALIFKGKLDLRGESKFTHARRTNNFVVVGVFLVTIINVFIASFTITGNNNNTVTSFPDPGLTKGPVIQGQAGL